MTGDSTIILGIEILQRSPLLSVVVGIHIPLGLACVVFGAIAMFSESAGAAIRRSARFITGARWPLASATVPVCDALG